MTMPAKIFELIAASQSYEWGKIGKDSAVARCVAVNPEFKIDESKPYAELWMGTHPSCPSIVKETSQPLSEVLKANPGLLGEKVNAKFGNGELPFLFKILSIHKALSIQAHPDKALGKELHERDPKNYKDDNHKPEMTIALTPFTGFCGFRPLAEISHFLSTVPELATLLGSSAQTFQTSFSKSPSEGKEALKQLFTTLMNSKEEEIAAQAELLVDRAKNDGSFGEDGELAKLLVQLDLQFPKDVGLFCAFFLNYVELSPGEAMFLRARDIHAYISGDVVECMAASDNVVRAGFTPKYKDIPTLTTMLTYHTAPASDQKMQPLPFQKCHSSTLYDPPIEEFSVVRTELNVAEEEMDPVDGPSILIVTSGNGSLKGVDQEFELKMGSVWFIGAGEGITLKSQGEMVTHRAFVEA